MSTMRAPYAAMVTRATQLLAQDNRKRLKDALQALRNKEERCRELAQALLDLEYIHYTHGSGVDFSKVIERVLADVRPDDECNNYGGDWAEQRNARTDRAKRVGKYLGKV